MTSESSKSSHWPYWVQCEVKKRHPNLFFTVRQQNSGVRVVMKSMTTENPILLRKKFNPRGKLENEVIRFEFPPANSSHCIFYNINKSMPNQRINYCNVDAAIFDKCALNLCGTYTNK